MEASHQDVFVGMGKRKAHLSAESSADVGRWKSYPYQIGMLDAFTDPSIEILTVMKSARIGYTKMVNWDTGYHIEQEPCSQLIVQPTVEDAGVLQRRDHPDVERHTLLTGQGVRRKESG